MGKKAFIVIVILVATGAGVAYLLARPAERDSKSAQTAATEPIQTETTATNDSTPGQYIDYSATALAEAKGTKLLFFHAPWCPQCRELDEDIKAKGVPAGVSIFKVDYDSSQSLRQKYGVTIQTTVVRVDDNGMLIEKFVAYDNPSLAAVTRELL